MSSRVPRLDGPIVLFAALAALIPVGGLGWAAGSSAAVAGVLGAWLWHRYLGGALAAVWFAPALVVLGGLAAGSGGSFPAELLAGTGALAILYWIGRERPDPVSGPSPALGLLVPGLGLTLALLVPTFLVGATAQIGLAGVLLAVLLLAFGYAIVAPEPGVSTPSPS